MKGNIDPGKLQDARLHIGSWLKERREAKGLSQAGLADILGVEQATVSKVEAGKWAISVDMLTLFCTHLDYPIKKIFKNGKVH